MLIPLPAPEARRRVALLLVAGLGYGVLHVGLHKLQTAVAILVNGQLSFELMFLPAIPTHGLRVLAAWFFGWSSMVVLLPTTLYIYANALIAGNPAVMTPAFTALALCYLASAPVAFWVLRLCLGPAGHPVTLEWRMIMLAGAISALINVIALGIYNPPPYEARETLLWLVARAVAYVGGLMVILLALLFVLRQLGRQLRRIG